LFKVFALLSGKVHPFQFLLREPFGLVLQAPVRINVVLSVFQIFASQAAILHQLSSFRASTSKPQPAHSVTPLLQKSSGAISISLMSQMRKPLALPAFVFQRGFAVSPQFAWFRLVPMDMRIFLARFLVMTCPPLHAA
jgi:hypothetical protein